MSFADKLKELRARAGLSQSQLANASEIPAGTIRNYEQGIREPSWRGLYQLVAALGADYAEFTECLNSKVASKKSKRRG